MQICSLPSLAVHLRLLGVALPCACVIYKCVAMQRMQANSGTSKFAGVGTGSRVLDSKGERKMSTHHIN